MKKLLLPLIMLLSLLSASPAIAGDDVWNMAESEEYGKKTWGMLGRGLINAASCFVDLAVQTVEKTQDGPPLVGTLTGIGSGAGCTILRAGSGILDVASFWVPGFNGIPVSRSYSNCMDIDQVGPYSTAPKQSYAAPSFSNAQASNQKPTVVSGTNSVVSSGKVAPGNERTVQTNAPASTTTTVKSSAAPVKKHDPMKYVKK